MVTPLVKVRAASCGFCVAFVLTRIAPAAQDCEEAAEALLAQPERHPDAAGGALERALFDRREHLGAEALFSAGCRSASTQPFCCGTGACRWAGRQTLAWHSGIDRAEP